MKVLLIAALFILRYSNASGSNVISYPIQNDSLSECFLKEESQKIKRFNDLPKSVRKKLKSLNGEKFKITRKERRFNKTDLWVLWDSLVKKSRLLTFLEGSKSFYIIGYQHGGRAFHNHVLIFDKTQNQFFNYIPPIKIDKREELNALMLEKMLKEQTLRDL